jgi:hypothetical protein
MGTRQRIIHTTEINENATTLEGKDVQLVQKNGSVYFINVRKIAEGQIFGKDQFGHGMVVSLKEIEELILDKTDA